MERKTEKNLEIQKENLASYKKYAIIDAYMSEWAAHSAALTKENNDTEGETDMEILKTREDTSLVLALVGRLDTVTAPALEAEVSNSLDGVTQLVMDFEKLDYISSAGLRVLLAAQKRMNKQGSMTVKNVNADIREVFEITGFCDILTIE